MQMLSPEIQVRFPVESLVSRRSFIFARAGFGKSNLNKLLFSKLYATTPTIKKRGGKDVPVGTVVFDPDGEYFWPDDKGRPGLCDVPALVDKLVVFTPRSNPSAFYQSFVAGGIRLDIRRLRPTDVIAIAISPERQDQQNVRKLRSLSQGRWEELVDLIDANRNATPLDDMFRLLDLDPQRQEAEALAARANMTAVVGMLHDRSSQLMDMLMHSLGQGKLCVIDVSQMRGAQALVLSGLILRRIFDRNQQEFTSADPKTIPTIAVVEEAQSVLNENASASEPYVSWVKEGRKYDLGALLITQQPGSIPVEILSQGDNWFIFHLLSSADLFTLKKANSHFSDDLLSSLLNEPIPGQGVFWSSVAGKPYPISLRVSSFERAYKVLDPNYSAPAAKTFADTLRKDIGIPTPRGARAAVEPEVFVAAEEQTDQTTGEGLDPLAQMERNAIEALRANQDAMGKLRSEDGMAWGSVKALLLAQLPEHLDDRDGVAYRMVVKALNTVLGPQNQSWVSYRNPARGGKTYVRLKK
jgi:hypothetical protein